MADAECYVVEADGSHHKAATAKPRALELHELPGIVAAYAQGTANAIQAGFDGVEVHAANGYLLDQFLCSNSNQRSDAYGGSVENRARIIHEIIDGVRARTRSDFQVGLRLSPERFGLQLGEMREVVQRLLHDGRLDYVDLSLWDVFKEPNEEAYRSRPLVDWFTDLDRRDVKLGVAGKIMDGATARRCLQHGADFVTIGRAAILHHDFPERLRKDPDFAAMPLPVSAAHLRAEGLGPAFVDYMKTWKGFVAEETAQAAVGNARPVVVLNLEPGRVVTFLHRGGLRKGWARRC